MAGPPEFLQNPLLAPSDLNEPPPRKSRAHKKLLRRLVQLEEMGELYLSLPYSDIRGWEFEDRSLIIDLDNTPVMARLNGVRQLGILTAGNVEHGGGPEMHFYGFTHTRRGHSLMVAKVGQRILQRNKFPPQEVDKIIFAGCLHDGATPAGGDAIIALDKENLDEETHWQEVLEPRSLRHFRKKEVNVEEIDKIIRNGGVLGQVLDIADRITYVADDAYNLVGHPPQDTRHPVYLDEYFSDFYWQLKSSGKFANVYKDVTIDQRNQQVYFNNSQRLYNFLKLRALLIKGVYLHPLNQTRDALVMKLAQKYYTADEGQPGLLTPSRLREMTDDSLYSYLDGEYKFKTQFSLFRIWNFWGLQPRFKRFYRQEEAARFAKAISLDPERAFLTTREVRSFKTGIHYLVKDSDGQVKPFIEAEPEKAWELDEIAQGVKGFYVLAADLREKNQLNILLKRALKE